ncbi:MAG: YdcF family protein [Gammaproteobacteria bacterium]|jgi:uncharacterized SAM-binding protein YcdF (DUF218 family)|nr:YdcF family protein [Gammaproteobacteria bacterium]
MQMLFNPLSATLIAVLLLLILWLLTRRNGFLVAIVVVNLLLWLSATPWLSRNTQSLLEQRAGGLSAESLPRADAIVVLGGTLSPPEPAATDANLSAAADRLVYATRLYKLGKAPIVLIAGGNADGTGAANAESVHAAQLLGEWGIPASAILTETESTNTYENAVYSKLMLDQHGLKTVLLVTSAMHMPRALATFRSAGIEATPAPTDFEASGSGPPGLADWAADPAALAVTTRTLREYVGWLVYRSRGWIAGDD